MGGGFKKALLYRNTKAHSHYGNKIPVYFQYQEIKVKVKCEISRATSVVKNSFAFCHFTSVLLNLEFSRSFHHGPLVEIGSCRKSHRLHFFL